MTLQKIIPLLFITLLAACEGCKDDPTPKTELEKLPPATQEGKNTFGCLVNGKAWVTETSIDAVVAYQLDILQISACLNDKERDDCMSFYAFGDRSVEVINLAQNQNAGVGFDSAETNCIYPSENAISGNLSITKLDETKLIISGTFEFTTVISGCDTIKVTDGRFDLTYAN
jgi:hypothetical protein